MDYIPGYTLLKNLASIPTQAISYLTASKTNTYELFANPDPVADRSNGTSSVQLVFPPMNSYIPGYSTLFPATSNSNIKKTNFNPESNFPRWSDKIQYYKGDGVNLNGFLYTSVKESSNINPVLATVDNFITVNSDFWSWKGLSSKVKQYNPETDMSNVYAYADIVDFNGILYRCLTPGTGCTADYTTAQWGKLSENYVKNPIGSNTSNTSSIPSGKEVALYGALGIYSVINNLTIQDIPGESLSDTFWRCVRIYYPYVLNIIIFILALVFASFSANDLLHKHYLYRILAFIYTLYYVNAQGYLSFGIFCYYLFRSIGGSYFDMKPLKIHGILPIWEDPSYNSMSFIPPIFTYPVSLRSSIEEDKKIEKDNRLASHGDVVKFLRDALHIQLPKNRNLGLTELINMKNTGVGPKKEDSGKGQVKRPGEGKESGENKREGKEPEAKEPEAKEPEAKEPEGKEPEAKEPEAKEPEAKEPEAKEPEAKGPEAKEPGPQVESKVQKQ
jgi:hypothetical protein